MYRLFFGLCNFEGVRQVVGFWWLLGLEDGFVVRVVGFEGGYLGKGRGRLWSFRMVFWVVGRCGVRGWYFLLVFCFVGYFFRWFLLVWQYMCQNFSFFQFLFKVLSFKIDRRFIQFFGCFFYRFVCVVQFLVLRFRKVCSVVLLVRKCFI